MSRHDPCHVPTSVHGRGVEEEDGDSIAGQQTHEDVQDQVRRGEPRPDGKGFGGGPFDQEEGVGEVVPETFQLVGEQEVSLLGEEVAVQLGEVGLPFDAAPIGRLGEDVVAGGQAARKGVDQEGPTGGGPGHGAPRDGEEGGEQEGCFLPVVDEDEVGPLQTPWEGFEPATRPSKGGRSTVEPPGKDDGRIRTCDLAVRTGLLCPG